MQPNSSPQARTTAQDLRPVHIFLKVQTVVVILVSINRLSALVVSYVAANEFLRWVDLNNMLILPLISLIAFYLLKKQLEKGNLAGSPRVHLLLNLIFISGVYLLGAGYGDHEVTNYLHIRFCPTGDGNDLCRIIIFNDDEFSHWVFFNGFVFVNAALLFLQVLFPFDAKAGNRDIVFLLFNGFFIGLGIFANLAVEVIGLDLFVVAMLMILALGLWWHFGRRPLFVYYSTAYTFGLLATVLYKGLPL